MTGDSWAGLADWNEKAVLDEEGNVAICFGLAATLYFRDGHKKDKRQAALSCFKDYDSLCPGALRWHCVGSEWMRMSPVAKLKNRDMSPYLLSAKWEMDEAYNHHWAFYWHGGSQRYDADPHRINCFGSSRLSAETSNDLSFMQVSFPIMWFQENPAQFSDLLLRWCNRLSPYHGYGGITLLTSPDAEITEEYAAEVAGFAGRYPGIEIDEPIEHEYATRERIKGANWITVLSESFVENLGGRHAIKTLLDKPFIIKNYEGGIVIIAGEMPEIGDKNRNINTPNYRKLARALKPIRIEDHPALYSEGRFADEDEFKGWLARFDDT